MEEKEQRSQEEQARRQIDNERESRRRELEDAYWSGHKDGLKVGFENGHGAGRKEGNQALKQDLASMKDIKERYEAMLQQTAETSSNRARQICEQRKRIDELERNCRDARWINEKLQETIDRLRNNLP